MFQFGANPTLLEVGVAALLDAAAAGGAGPGIASLAHNALAKPLRTSYLHWTRQ